MNSDSVAGGDRQATPASTPVGADERQRLEQFLKRRQLKDRIVAVLEEAKERHNLKRGQVTTSKTATYEELVEALASSLNHEWLETDKITAVLDDAELAGRQHVCLFVVNEADLQAIQKSLAAPVTLNTDKVALEEFWDIPLEPYTRILVQSDDEIISKTMTGRKYWVETDRVTKEDYIRIERKREKERAALVIKLDAKERLLQFRVPIKEAAPGVDTSKSVYEFIAEMVESQYGKEGIEWLNRLKPLPIGDAFQKIVENRTDFELHTDHPENKHFKSVMSKKGPLDGGKDIRDFDEWVYESGFARSCIRGMWTAEPDWRIDVRMHYESVKVNDAVTRFIARLYFAKPYSDQEVEYVIRRVREHI